MRVSDTDILIVPGRSDSGPDHWQSRWQAKLSTARRVEQDDWERPERTAWVGRLSDAVAAATRPVVLVAHGLGVPLVAHAAPHLPSGVVRGAFLVGTPDIEANGDGPIPAGFAPLPREPLPFPSLLIASRTDPSCAYGRAEDLALAWGARLIDAGEAGHIDAASGHGPWPEGLVTFAAFLKRL